MTQAGSTTAKRLRDQLTARIEPATLVPVRRASTVPRVPDVSVAGRDDRMLRETRVLAVVVIPVLVTAAIVLLGFPDRTEDLFAWKIQAHMSSFALAVPYTAGIYFFARVLVDGRWHRVAAGLLAVGAFVTAEGIATLLHWDRFAHGNPAFWLWALLYLTTPFIVPVVWWRNRATDPGTAEVDDVGVPVGARVAFLVGGVALLAVAVFLLVATSSAIGIWPWPLTPLTARSTAGWFAFGLVGVMLFSESRWSAARVVVEAMLLSLGLALVSVGRAWSEFDTGRVSTWVFVATLVAALVLMLLLYAVMERRRRRHDAPAARRALGRPEALIARRDRAGLLYRREPVRQVRSNGRAGIREISAGRVRPAASAR